MEQVIEFLPCEWQEPVHPMFMNTVADGNGLVK